MKKKVKKCCCLVGGSHCEHCSVYLKTVRRLKARRTEELRIIVGAGAYKNGKDDYAGLVGVIRGCNKCCGGKLRVQFFEIGNNEPLSNFKLNYCEFFIAQPPNIKDEI